MQVRILPPKIHPQKLRSCSLHLTPSARANPLFSPQRIAAAAAGPSERSPARPASIRLYVCIPDSRLADRRISPRYGAYQARCNIHGGRGNKARAPAQSASSPGLFPLIARSGRVCAAVGDLSR